MDRLQRLQLLFDEDASLLKIDSGLHTVSLPQPSKPVDQTDSLNTDKPDHGGSPQLGNPDHDNLSQPDLSSDEVLEGGVQLPGTLDTCEQHSKPNQELESAAQVQVDTPDPSICEVHDGSFCPIVAVSRYPYEHVKGELSQTIASQFFDRGKFWSRNWDMYYIHLPSRLGSRPLLLAPAVQVRQLFQEINHELKCNLFIPTDSKLGMLLPFQTSAWFPQPTYIGECSSQEDKDRLLMRIPPFGRTESPSEMDEEYLAFEKMLEAAVESAKSKKKTSKAKQQQRIQRQQRLVHCFERTQSYLGLRSHEHPYEPAAVDAASWEEKQSTPDVDPQALPRNANEPVPLAFWKEPIFISVDVECNERCHSQVTEVGISTLDMSDLVGVAPGEQGSDWISRIQSRHLRVEEYKHVKNREFMVGCPGSFEFGTSEWVSVKVLATIVQSYLDSLANGDNGPRHLVLIGHNTSADLQYLRNLGVQVEQIKGPGGITDIGDTAEFYRIIKGEATVRSLGGVLADLGIIGWNLHNAGNDARYTMEVLIRMMLEYAG